jgi:hypothetical protein
MSLPARRPEFDWLRVFALGLMFVFHSAIGFGTWPWVIKDAHTSWLLDNLCFFVWPWRVSLVFVVSGTALMLALRVRTPRAILLERFQRLLPPLIFGMLVLIPPQVYLERLQNGQFRGSYLEFLPHFADGIYPAGNLSWHHLWFIPYALILTVVMLPLFSWLRVERERPRLTRLKGVFVDRHLYWLLLVPIFVADIILRTQANPSYSVIHDPHGWIEFASLFVLGGLIGLWPDMLGSIQRGRYFSLAAAVMAFAALKTMTNDPALLSFGQPFVRDFFSALNQLAWVLTAIGFVTRIFNRSSSFLAYATEAAMPVYVLHQSLIVFAVYHLHHVSWPLPVKYVLTFCFTLLGSLALYELAVRRSRVLRFLFGVKARARHIGAETLVPPEDAVSVTSRWRAPSS